MEKNGAEVYKGKIEITAGIPDNLNSEDFDWESCRKSLKAIAKRPRLPISYFIGIDKTVHIGLGLKGDKKRRDPHRLYVNEIAGAALAETLVVLRRRPSSACRQVEEDSKSKLRCSGSFQYRAFAVLEIQIDMN